jgi:hypothetical protein
MEQGGEVLAIWGWCAAPASGPSRTWVPTASAKTARTAIAASGCDRVKEEGCCHELVDALHLSFWSSCPTR